MLKWNFTCFRQFLCPSSGVFHRTHTPMVYVIQVCWQFARKLSADLYDIYHWCECVRWKTPDDGQRNCPKHV